MACAELVGDREVDEYTVGLATRSDGNSQERTRSALGERGNRKAKLAQEDHNLWLIDAGQELHFALRIVAFRIQSNLNKRDGRQASSQDERVDGFTIAVLGPALQIHDVK